jgi:hypothetical protein
MANRNPWKARLARWKRLWPVPIAELEAQAFAVMQVAYEGVSTDDPDERRKAVLCYFQALTSFTKLHEATELEARVTALEAERYAGASHEGNGHVT